MRTPSAKDASPDRRAVLKAGIVLCAGLATRTSAAQDAASLMPREGDLLVRDRDASATPLTPDMIVSGAPPISAWAMDPEARTVRSGSRLNALLLVRLDLQSLAPDTRARSADGIVAYTAICTHNGCDVDDWLKNEQVLSCSCHSSMFDPKDGARVVDGPAPRGLPALPLAIVGGRIVVAGPFTSKVGFEKG
jgi:nitrite reductase/ring-hydroxylating ferredoxin subunit